VNIGGVIALGTMPEPATCKATLTIPSLKLGPLPCRAGGLDGKHEGPHDFGLEPPDDGDHCGGFFCDGAAHGHVSPIGGCTCACAGCERGRSPFVYA